MAERLAQASSRPTQMGLSNRDLEWLVAELADEAEHWRSQADAFEAAIDELRAELARHVRHAEIVEAWRQGLSSELLAFARSSDDDEHEAQSRALALVLPVSLLLWGLVGLLIYGGYRLFSG